MTKVINLKLLICTLYVLLHTLLLTSQNPNVPTEIAHNPFFCKVIHPTNDRQVSNSRGAAAGAALWREGQTLRVKFMGASTNIHNKIESYAKEWEAHANIKFQFVNSGYADIRISLNMNEGPYSALGTAALRVPENFPTMNLRVDNTIDDLIARYTTLHEFGHVLGLEHEHQHPDHPIRWNKQAVYNAFPHWPREDVDSGILNRLSTEGLYFCEYDPSSIMHYGVYDEWTTNNRGVAGSNGSLSEEDKRFIAKLYPATGVRESQECLCDNACTDYRLTATVDGQGALKISDANNSGQVYDQFSASYKEGERVTIEAVPNAGYRFVRWRGTSCDNSSARTCTITMTRDQSVTAVVAPNCTDIFYADADNDGLGDENTPVTACEAPTGYVDNSDDCDDTNAALPATPGSSCTNGTIAADGCTCTPCTNVFYADTDNDGLGDENAPLTACTVPFGYVDNSEDCDDTDATLPAPFGSSCSGGTIAADGCTCIPCTNTFYADMDEDGFGDENAPLTACTPPSGYVANSEDCDDTNAAIPATPGASCNGGTIAADGCTCTPTIACTNTFYADTDEDGLGDAATTITACEAPTGYVDNSDDCDDTNASLPTTPGTACVGGTIAEDSCTCTPTIACTNTFYADTDEDGLGDAATTITACKAPTGYVDNSDDCDDTNASLPTTPGTACIGGTIAEDGCTCTPTTAAIDCPAIDANELSTSSTTETTIYVYTPQPYGAINNQFRYRADNTTDWQLSDTSDLYYRLLSNLSKGTTYEFQVAQECSTGQWSDFSSSQFFTTEGQTEETIAESCLSFELTTQVETCQIAINITKGTGPYTLTISGAQTTINQQLHELITGLTLSTKSLPTGAYECTVKDDNNCEMTQSFTVTACNTLDQPAPVHKKETNVFSSEKLAKAITEKPILTVPFSYPNPFTTSTHIPFNLIKNGRVTVELFLASGQRIYQQSYDLEAGEQQIQLQGNLFPETGAYFYSIRAEGQFFGGQLTKL